MNTDKEPIYPYSLVAVLYNMVGWNADISLTYNSTENIWRCEAKADGRTLVGYDPDPVQAAAMAYVRCYWRSDAPGMSVMWIDGTSPEENFDRFRGALAAKLKARVEARQRHNDSIRESIRALATPAEHIPLRLLCRSGWERAKANLLHRWHKNKEH